MIFTAVPYEAIDAIWPQAEKLLDEAIPEEDHRYDISLIWSGIDKKWIALWVVIDDENDDEVVAAVTTEIKDYVGGRALEMNWVGGKRMDEWMSMVEEKLEQYAKDMGCDFMTGQGRRGWARLSPKFGWKQSEYVSYRKELNNGRR